MKKATLLIVFLLFSLVTIAQKLQWSENYGEALRIAQDDQKNIILFFTDGSDAKKERLVRQEFFKSSELKAMSNQLVFVNVDESKPNKLSAKDKIFNNRLLTVFNPNRMFPALQLLNVSSTSRFELLTDISEEKLKAFIQQLNTIE